MQAISSALATDPGRAADTAGAQPVPVEVGLVAVFDNLSAAAPAWRRLAEVAPATPYGQHAWAEAWCATVGADRHQTPLIGVAYDRQDRPIAVFPFVVHTIPGLRTARFIGGKDSNGNLALFADPDAWDTAALEMVLSSIGTQAGVDLFVLRNQPAAWRGRANPLARLPHQASPSGVAATLLRPSLALSKQARKRLRQKSGWLEALGPVDLQRATTRTEVELFLAAHLAQRAARAEAAGVPCPSAAQIAFYQHAADPLRDGGTPVELYALRCGPEIVATFGGTGAHGRYSGMILSVDARAGVSRCSPGELLLRRLLPDLARRGYTSFDLGIGEARYKASVCTDYEPLIDCFVSVTAVGRIAAVGFAAGGRIKRRIKQSGPVIARLRAIAMKARRGATGGFSRP